jgi:hypothetical protein
MALSARIQFGDNGIGQYSSDYQLSECKTHFTRHHSAFFPDEDAKCMQIELTIVASNKYDLNIQEWFIDRSCLSGRIVFELSSIQGGEQGSGPLRTIEFEDAECFSLGEKYDIGVKTRREFKLLITARLFKIGDTVFERR